MSDRKTAPCIGCGKPVSKWLGASHRYPMGVRTADGYRCQPCFAKRVSLDAPSGPSVSSGVSGDQP